MVAVIGHDGAGIFLSAHGLAAVFDAAEERKREPQQRKQLMTRVP
nr:hypothetical protein [Paraburkholderia sp. BL8N3]